MYCVFNWYTVWIHRYHFFIAVSLRTSTSMCIKKSQVLSPNPNSNTSSESTVAPSTVVRSLLHNHCFLWITLCIIVLIHFDLGTGKSGFSSLSWSCTVWFRKICCCCICSGIPCRFTRRFCYSWTRRFTNSSLMPTDFRRIGLFT